MMPALLVMCHELTRLDPYIAHVTKRIVAMFESYARDIDAEDEGFLNFISEYLARHNIKDPKTIPYSHLYRNVKEGIQEYLRQREMQ